MAEQIRTITFDHLMTIAVPEGLYANVIGTVFIDGIGLPDDTRYKSAALVGSPDKALTLGIVYYDVEASTFRVQKAAQGPLGGWPLGAKIAAACGVEGGLAAFAGQDEGIPFVDVYNSPLSSGADSGNQWTHRHSITFDNYAGTTEGVTGTVQNMLERDGKLYGFIKSKSPQRNGFFFADALQPSTATVVPYTGNAALAFLPLDTENADTMMQRRIAFYGKNKLYAVDESRSYVLCADLDTHEVSSFPLKKTTTLGLLMHADPNPDFNKAYTGYDPESDGYIMPYTVNPGGDFTRGKDTIVGGSGVCPSLDQNLGLLYTIEIFAQAPVIDIRTDKPVTLAGDPLPKLEALAGTPGTWVDSAENMLYVSGVNGVPAGSRVPDRIAVYRASSK